MSLGLVDLACRDVEDPVAAGPLLLDATALRARGVIEVSDCANVNTSYPGFVEQASQVGLRIRATTEQGK